MAKLEPGVNDLATVNPELAAQLVDPSIASTLTSGSNKSVRWFCEGTPEIPHPRREWSAMVNTRSNGSGCAVCAGQAVLVGWNDLTTVEPELAAQLVDPTLAQRLTRGSIKSVEWFCTGTHALPHPRYEWSATTNNRWSGSGCPACSGRAVIIGWNDLTTVEPELAAQLVDPTLAQRLTRGSGKSVEWFCTGTHALPHPRYEWPATIDNRAKGRGCPACSGRAVIIGWNDLTTVNPELAAQLVDPTLTQRLTRGSGKSVEWFCEGTVVHPHPRHEWSTTVAYRSKGRGCPVCSGRAVIIGWNDLTTVNPELAAQLVDPNLAETLTYNASESVQWFCTGTSERPHPRHQWSATAYVRSKGTRLPGVFGQGCHHRVE